MRAPKRKWTAEEEEALKAGIKKHGAGNWRSILNDPEFRHSFGGRSIFDLCKYYDYHSRRKEILKKQTTRTPQVKWTSEEEEALKAGVNKHGPGKWKIIQKDPEFGQILSARSNIDLKDKWRNLSASATGEGSRQRVKAAASTPKVPKNPAFIFQSPPSSSQTTVVANDKILDPAENTPDGKPARYQYDFMILEAVYAIKDPNGADIGAIYDFIKKRHQVPTNFRKLLSPKLRRLVAQGKLEKVQNYYKIKKNVVHGTRTPTQNSEDNKTRKSQDKFPVSIIEGSALYTAQKIAEAENKSFVACEAVKEAEKVEEMAEHSALMKQFFEDILERCKRGEPVIMAY